jgi:hypothetical protein
MKKLIVIFFIATIFLASCTISQSYHINKDFSGTAETSVEMGELIKFMNSMDTTGKGFSTDTIDQAFETVALELKNAGAKDVEYGWKNEKTTLFVKYTFDNLESVNNLLKETNKQSVFALAGDNGSDGSIKFSNKGSKTLIYDAPEVSDSLRSNQQYAAMKDYIYFSVNFTFERQIKKIDNKRAIISDDKKSFSIKGNIMDLMAPDFTSDFTVKLK